MIISISGTFAQDRAQFVEEFTSIEKELVDWDPVRGEWLSNSMVAIAHNEATPDRNFPENITPYQMMTQVPQDIRERIQSNVQINCLDIPVR